jgi:hypothetical protein
MRSTLPERVGSASCTIGERCARHAQRLEAESFAARRCLRRSCVALAAVWKWTAPGARTHAWVGRGAMEERLAGVERGDWVFVEDAVAYDGCVSW